MEWSIHRKEIAIRDAEKGLALVVLLKQPGNTPKIIEVVNTNMDVREVLEASMTP